MIQIILRVLLKRFALQHFLIKHNIESTATIPYTEIRRQAANVLL